VTERGRVLPLFPLEQVVLFPGMPLPLRIFEERYKVMIGACQVTDQIFGVLLIRSGREVGAPAEPEQIGCTARLHRLERMPDGQLFVLTMGEQRFRLSQPARVMPEGYLVGDVEMLVDPPAGDVEPELLARVTDEFDKYQAASLVRLGQTDRKPPALPTEPTALSYRVGAMLQVEPRERQPLLELDDVAERLREELALLKRENRLAAHTIGPFSMN
jgi:Lon protease-like protein